MPKVAPPEEKVCIVCGETFMVGGRGRPSRKQERCSTECQRKSRYRSGRICAQLSLEDAVYLAGFWDADGSFIIHGRADRSHSISFRAQVTGTKEVVIQWIKDVTGVGSLHRHTPPDPKRDRHATSWSWWANGDAGESFAKQLIPYLKLKKEQAELGVTFQERLRNPALKAEPLWQEEWMLKMRRLNAKGQDGSMNYRGGNPDDDRFIRRHDSP